jgi:hypothetical protein
MEAVHGFAQQMQPPVPLSVKQAQTAGQPLLINLVPWPDAPRLSEVERERLASTLRVEAVGLPDDVASFEVTARNDPNGSLYQYLRARALTYLRQCLNALCDARLCLGGRTSGFAGRYPGIIEEAFLAVQNEIPLYLAGSMGGAARQVISAFTGEELPNNFCIPNETYRLYKTPPVAERHTNSNSDHVADRRAVWSAFQSAGIQTLAKTNRLTHEENEELFYTPSLDRIAQLTLIGVSRLRSSDNHRRRKRIPE